MAGRARAGHRPALIHITSSAIVIDEERNRIRVPVHETIEHSA
jgi:hypothetical protein